MSSAARKDAGRYIRVEESWAGGMIKRAACSICGQEVLSLPKEATESQINVALVGLEAHFSIQHDMQLELVPCNNPECCK